MADAAAAAEEDKRCEEGDGDREERKEPTMSFLALSVANRRMAKWRAWNGF